MAPNAPDFNPQQGSGSTPYDPTNVNDPRYDPARDPRYDPRWQRNQQRFFRDQERARQNADRASTRAQAAAWRAQARAQRDQWKMYRNSQRRSSIIGPLLLIATGVVVYLVHVGRVEPLRFFGWYAHWWPVLLIAIGVLRLAEWAFDRARRPQDAPAMRYTVGGGVVFAVIVLSCLGLVLHAGGDWRADRNGVGFLMRDFTDGGHVGSLFGEKHEEDAAPVVHDLVAGTLLSIDNPHGDVTVTGTSDDGRLHLSVHKEVFTNSDSTAEERLRAVSPVLESTGTALNVRVPSVEGSGADLTLLVPTGTRVVLNSNRGDVHVSNMKSALSVTANNGDVEIAAISSSVQVHVNNRRRDLNVRSVTGDVTVDGNGDEVTMSDIAGAVAIRGDFYGGGHLQRVNGPVEYHSSRTDISFARLSGELQIDGHDLSASEVVGPMLVNTRSRNVSLDRVTGDIKVVNSHGDVDVHVAPPTGTLTVDNQNGSVNISMPSQAKFTLNAETSDGDTHSDFANSETHGSRGILSGSVNGGGAAVRLNTSHGDINISRNSIAALPAAPPRTPRVLSTGGGFETMDTSQTRQLEQMQRDAMTTAAAALRESAQQARQDARASTSEARERTREALQQARDAVRDARAKQKEAEQEARDAERSRQ